MSTDANHEEDDVVAVVEPRPWGFWATAGFGLMIAMAFAMVQIVVVVCFVVVENVTNPAFNAYKVAEHLENNGLFLSVATCATTASCTPLVFLFAWVRKGLSTRRYLALEPIRLATLAQWLAFQFVLIVAIGVVTLLLDRPAASEFMVDIYATASIPLLWVALVGAAPIFEEFFFRGFLFAGFRASRLRTYGAIVMCSLLWTVIHPQYDFYQLTTVFVIGLLLGLARHRTGSIYAPLAMHSLVNAVATAGMAFDMAFQ